MNDIELQKIADESYDRFIKDESIIGFEGLLKPFGGGSRRRNKIRKLIYDKYGKEKLINIYRSRLAKSSHKNRTSESYYISEEQRERMNVGVKKSWENADSRREQNRELMTRYCLPKAHTDATNVSRVESRRDGAGWKPHSEETREKLSELFLAKWKNGDYDDRLPTLRSKGQIEMGDIIRKLGYNVIEEYRVSNKPFDVGIPDKKLLVEFNGTYWHCDPRVYEPYFYDKSRGMYAWEVWHKDNKKKMDAITNGYKVISIWQIDWDGCENKQRFLEKVIHDESIR